MEFVRRKSKELMAAAWLLTIFLSSSTVVTTTQLTQGVAKAGVSQATFTSFWQDWWWVFVKGWHMTEFAILFLLLARCLRLGPALMIAVGYAALDEFHQTFVPLRGGRLTDVLIDTAGILVAVALLAIWRSLRDAAPGTRSAPRWPPQPHSSARG